MDISVVVPTYNRRDLVLRSLETLFAQDFDPARFEVIMVVDGSTDGTAEALRALQPRCRFRVLEQENRGPSAARNAGFRVAEADLLLFLDDDMLCEPGLVAAHVAAHRRPGIHVAFGAVFLSPDSVPSLAAECFYREIGSYYLEHQRNPQIEWPIPHFVLNVSLPRALLAQVGGFDEAFKMREDMDLGIRLFERGARSLYASDAIVHEYYDKTAADLIRDARVFAAGDVLLARKHPAVLIEGQLNWVARHPSGKQRMLWIAASAPWVADVLLSPVCAVSEALLGFEFFRRLGVRALQMRRRIHWYRRAMELGWRFPAR